MRYRLDMFALPSGETLRVVRLLVRSLPLAALGCSSAPSVVVKEPAPAAALASAKRLPPTAPGHIERGEVDRVLVERGPAWIFRRVRLEEVILPDGKFSGWRITALPEEWGAIDVQPGDIVSKVNGLPVETHDDAWEIWKSVASSPVITLALVRDGKAREARIPIDGPVIADTRKALERGPSSRPPPPVGPSEESITIGGAPQGPVEGDAY
jgi:S1-C subfamily serine protease